MLRPNKYFCFQNLWHNYIMILSYLTYYNSVSTGYFLGGIPESNVNLPSRDVKYLSDFTWFGLFHPKMKVFFLFEVAQNPDYVFMKTEWPKTLKYVSTLVYVCV